MKVGIIVFLILFLVIGLCYAVDIEHAIVVDSSGSMAGFYNTGAIRMLVLNLQKILGGAKIYLFSDSGPVTVGRADALHSINRDTRIDLAIQGFLDGPGARPDTIWLITDNVQDRSETPYVDASIMEFYSILRQNEVTKIYIMPCYLDFDGKVYVNREGRQYAEEYTGRKGLIIYAILLNNTYIKQFEDLASRFGSTLTAYESKLLLAKPLDKATFDLKPSEQISGGEKPNVSLVEKGVFFGRGFKEGRKIPVVFYVKLLSKFEDLIVSGKVNASVVDNHFTSLGFKDTFVACSIYPEKVSIDPGKVSETIYKITINIDKVGIKKNPVSILRSAFSGKPGQLKCIIRLEVQVPREGFRFTDGVLRVYNTDDIDDYRRIYGIGSLINYMPADVTMIPIEYSIILAVNYPHWPLILVLLLIAIVIGMVYLIYRVFSSIGGEKFAISVGGREERITSFVPLIGSYNITMAGNTWGAIYKNLNGDINAKARKGFLIDGTLKKKRLNRDMDSFTLADNDGTNSVDVHFRSLRKEDKLEDIDSDLDAGF